MREDLAATGQPPSEDDFYYIMYFLTTPIFLLSTRLRVRSFTLSADELKREITDDFNRHALSSVGDKEENDAF